MSDLSQAQCIPCPPGTAKLPSSERERLIAEIPGWTLATQEGVMQLEKSFRFHNFVEAIEFANQVGKIAEQEQHHPTLLVEWGHVKITWWTHSINGLHINDFIMSARTSQIYDSLLSSRPTVS